MPAAPVHISWSFFRSQADFLWKETWNKNSGKVEITKGCILLGFLLSYIRIQRKAVRRLSTFGDVHNLGFWRPHISHDFSVSV
jgi:hypothetical protein